MTLHRRMCCAALSGLLLSLAFPSWLLPGLNPGTGWLAWVALVPLFAAVEDARHRQAAVIGWAGGFTYFASTLYWVACIREMSSAAIPVWLAFAATLGLYWAAWAWLVAWAGARGTLLLAAPLWVAQEWLRGSLFTGFPWTPLGATQWGHPTVFLAARDFGVTGVGLAVAAVNVGAWALVRRRADARWAAGLAACWLTALGLSAAAGRAAVTSAASVATSVRIAALQGSFTEDEKWSLPVDTMLRRYESLAFAAARSGAAVMVWPETATASFIQAPGLIPFLTRLAARTSAAQVVGALDESLVNPSTRGRVYNAAFLVTGSGVTGTYRKTHLVPFGEYVPWWCRTFVPFVGKLTAQVADLTPGPAMTLLTLPGGARVGVYICYEAIFAAAGRDQVRQGAGLSINITNDAWYLRTAATFQHALGPVGRAVETGRWVVRAANTGLSLIADPEGRLQTGPSLFEPGIVVGDVRLLADRTGYVRWGDWPLVGYGLIMLLIWRRLR